LDISESVTGKLYSVLNEDPSEVGYVKERHMVAFEFRKLAKDINNWMSTFDFVGYFASGALHSAPIALNIINNVFLHAIYNGPNGRQYSVTAMNDPMPQVVVRTRTYCIYLKWDVDFSTDSSFINTNLYSIQPLKYEKNCGITCVLLAVVMSFTIACISHSCVLLPMLERQSGVSVDVDNKSSISSHLMTRFCHFR